MRHGVAADEEGVGYLQGGLADGEQPKDACLALRQRRWQSRVQSLGAAELGTSPATCPHRSNMEQGSRNGR